MNTNELVHTILSKQGSTLYKLAKSGALDGLAPEELRDVVNKLTKRPNKWLTNAQLEPFYGGVAPDAQEAPARIGQQGGASENKWLRGNTDQYLGYAGGPR